MKAKALQKEFRDLGVLRFACLGAFSYKADSLFMVGSPHPAFCGPPFKFRVPCAVSTRHDAIAPKAPVPKQQVRGILDMKDCRRTSSISCGDPEERDARSKLLIRRVY